MENRFFLRATPTIVARYSGISALLILDLDQIQSPRVKNILTNITRREKPSRQWDDKDGPGRFSSHCRRLQQKRPKRRTNFQAISFGATGNVVQIELKERIK